MIILFSYATAASRKYTVLCDLLVVLRKVSLGLFPGNVSGLPNTFVSQKSPSTLIELHVQSSPRT
jgi:hypothetical protein